MVDDRAFRPGDEVLVVHAHPDDEVFCTGAAILAARAAGARVRLRVFTGGEGRSTELTPAALSTARERRMARLAVACTHLGITEWGFLTFEGEWTDTPHCRENTIAAAPTSDLASAVARCLDDLRPDVVLTVGADGVTGHPDHVACHRAVATALSGPGWRPRLALGAVLEAKHVRTAQQNATRLFGTMIGSGRVRGAQNASPRVVKAPGGAGHRRRSALDAYTSGLGTCRVERLPLLSQSLGDSALLRLVLDVSGWDTDRFVPMVIPSP